MRAATFTTYINAQTDPGLESAFNRQAKLAESSYATITRAAEAATRATAGLLGGRGIGGAAAGNAQIQQRTAAIRTTVTAAAEAERASTRLVTATRREVAANIAVAQSNRTLAGSLTTTATALNVVSGRLDPVSSRVSTLSRAVTDLTGVQLGLAAFGATLFAIGRTANQYANLEARVRPFFETQKQVNAAMSDIVGIAQRSRSALEPVVDVYTRLTTVGQNIGLTRRDIGQVTEIATKASNIGGGTAQARDAALLQFGQALSGDFKAAGQEINSLKEQAPVLFQAILKGYKDVDGTIGVSLARFKKLSEAGDLSTASVLDAVRRSASYIDEMAARVPNTLGRAGTDFTNALQIQFGQLDQAVGLTSTLADGLTLVAANLRVIIALAAGAGTAFAAVKLGTLVTDGIAAVRTTQTMQAAVEQLGLRRKAIAAESLAQHQREVAAINAEQAEIRQNIALLERQRAVAARDVARNVPSPGYAGSTRLASAAAEEEKRAIRGLIAERQRLGVVQAAGVAANARAAASNTALARATANVTTRVGFLRSAAGSLIGFLGGPWTIIFAAAATAVYLLATAQSAAARAADQMRDSQSTLSQYIDRTTGRIIEQNSQLVRNRLLQAQDRKDTAKAGFVESNLALREATRGKNLDLGLGNGNIGGGVQAAADRFLTSGNGRDLKALQASIDNLRKFAPGSARKVDDLLTGYVESAKPLSSANAEIRLLQQNPRAGDVDRAYGERPTRGAGGAVAKPLSKAQIDANARAEAAQTEVQRARAALAQTKAGGKQAGETDIDYQHRLSAAYQAVTAAVNGEKQARAGASAGRAAERKAARDAIQDSKDEAVARRDAATEKLLASHPDVGSTEFLTARQKILQTYDDEINKIDASAAASHSATSQRLADLQKEEAAAAGRGEKRRDILANYDEAPKAIDRARDQIDDLQKNVDHLVDGLVKATDANPLGRGLYTQEMADADAERIEKGVRKPLADLQRDYERGVEIASLQLQGREAEASVIQKRNQLLDDGIELTRSEYDTLLANERQQLRINDALAARQRVVSAITGALDNARDTAETVITSLAGGAKVGNVFKTALSDFQSQFVKINARSLVEKLFAGSDEKLRALIEGKSTVDTAISSFGTSVSAFAGETGRGESAVSKFATAAEDAANRLNSINTSGGVGVGRGGYDEDAIGDGDIVVTGKRIAARNATSPTIPRFGTPTASQTFNSIGGSLFAPAAKLLDGLVNKIKPPKINTTQNADGTFNFGAGGSTFFKGLSNSFGTALQGAGTGAIASGFAKALGVAQSKTGASIGGAAGAFLPIPGGSIIGGLIGGTIGGLFKKKPTASASISVDANGTAGAGTVTGSSSALKGTASTLAKGVGSGLSSIAESLGATLVSNALAGITIGSNNGNIHVNAVGGKIGKKGSGDINFGQDQEAAVNFAITEALKRGVVDGISSASKAILASGQDLTIALKKATAIESIPKRLLQLTDPVKYAVSTLNDEFKQLIGYLTEGGASAQQFADAQKLYDLERTKAIESASTQAADQITQFLKDLVGGSSSPLNKATIYENAAADLNAFKKDITSGKTVDQSDLLSAARSFQDASRSLNGSSQSFFDDFDMLRGLLEQARTNAGVTTVTTLPASPFAETSVQATLDSLAAKATTDQTSTLVDSLDAVRAEIANLGAGLSYKASYGYESSIGLLPGFAA